MVVLNQYRLLIVQSPLSFQLAVIVQGKVFLRQRLVIQLGAVRGKDFNVNGVYHVVGISSKYHKC